ncbi:RDD family protein [Mycoplasma buteonis]|uniref:RDD family protein n=1 Tax=Mycoplasma buteonis TaxID=171280 RepID=UPI000564B48F|nr:RDD family protein [Mycoplasma buteonis]
MLYKNSPIFRRLIANIFDWLVLLSISYSFFALSSLANSNLNVNYYLPTALFFVWINFYFLLLPVITRGKTLGYIIFNLKIISTNEKKFTFLSLIKRNLVLTFLLDAALIIALSGVKPIYLLQVSENVKKVDQNKSQQLLLWLAIAFIDAVLLINFFGFFYGLFDKKNLTFTDIISNSRVVVNKPITEEKKIDLVFLPYYSHRRKYQYYQVNTDNLENYDFKEN